MLPTSHLAQCLNRWGICYQNLSPFYQTESILVECKMSSLLGLFLKKVTATQETPPLCRACPQKEPSMSPRGQRQIIEQSGDAPRSAQPAAYWLIGLFCFLSSSSS